MFNDVLNIKEASLENKDFFKGDSMLPSIRTLQFKIVITFLC